MSAGGDGPGRETSPAPGGAEPPPRDPLLDEALQIVTRFGPQRLRPKEERLLERHAGVAADRMRVLFDECARIEAWAYELAGRIDAAELSRDEALRQILARYPDLTSDTARLTLWHGTYYWWRDHG
jgi:hypothetical protein